MNDNFDYINFLKKGGIFKNLENSNTNMLNENLSRLVNKKLREKNLLKEDIANETDLKASDVLSRLSSLNRYNLIVNWDSDNATLNDKVDKEGKYVKWEDIEHLLEVQLTEDIADEDELLKDLSEYGDEDYEQASREVEFDINPELDQDDWDNISSAGDGMDISPEDAGDDIDWEGLLQENGSGIKDPLQVKKGDKAEDYNGDIHTVIGIAKANDWESLNQYDDSGWLGSSDMEDLIDMDNDYIVAVKSDSGESIVFVYGSEGAVVYEPTGVDEAKKDKEEDSEEEDADIEIDNSEEDSEDVEFDETDLEAEAPEGFSDEESGIQDSLKIAYDNAVALGDDKLAKQIGNTITMFTRTHIVNANQ